MTPESVTDEDLQRYVDAALAPERRAEVEAYLAAHPDDEKRVAVYRAQKEVLHGLYDRVLDQPVPPRLIRPRHSRRNTWLSHAASVLVGIALGAGASWWVVGGGDSGGRRGTGFAERAAVAHIVYAPEVRHPVEVDATQETHLVKWLSKRLGAPIKAPHLGAAGYQLVGGRLLPGLDSPVAQFMYENEKGERLTLYVRTFTGEGRQTAFQYIHEGAIGVFYWIDDRLGYAVAGEADRGELLRLSNLVYRQFNP